MPPQKRQAVGVMRQMGRSERRACELARLNRSTCRYRPVSRSDESMRTRLKELARRHLSYGTPRLTALLRREFGIVNHKRVERIYREEALQLPRRKKVRRRGPAPRQPLAVPTRPGERWSMDFMSDSLADGRRYRLLCIVDDFGRECLAIEVDTSIGGSGSLAFSIGLPTKAGCPTPSWGTTGQNLPVRPYSRGPSGTHVGRAAGRPASLHRAGTADAERLCRELQRETTGGMPESALVLEAHRSTRVHQDVASELQPGAFA